MDFGDDLISFYPETKRPEWTSILIKEIRNLLRLQTSISVHRSKLFSLFDLFRLIGKALESLDVDNNRDYSQACRNFLDTINRSKQLVYYCSAAHWSQTAISWPSSTVKDSVKRIREDICECLKEIGFQKCFSGDENQLQAENQVDLLQLKGSLMDYMNHLMEQSQTHQLQQVITLINERINSIGHVEGIHDGPPLVCVPPFLPSKLNLVLTHDQFSMGEVLGSGTFGSVHAGILVGTQKRVAIKVLHNQILGGRQLETFKREVWTMATLNHPSILRLIGVTLTPPFCIVTELHKCSLYDRLKYLSSTKRSVIALKVSQAMEQLHAARIIHRDLKSGNILLDEDDMPKVCDFGLVGFKTGSTRTGYVGTAQWMAPEILRSSPFYDEKVDVYSYSVLLWEMLTLQEPYQGMTQDRMVMGILEHGMRPQIPPQFGPQKLIDLIKACWADNPSKRPSFSQISQIMAQPEYHFVGTNEEEFLHYSPKEILSTKIIQAYDSGDLEAVYDIIQQIDRDIVENDSQLLPIIITIFPSLQTHHQEYLIRILPTLMDFDLFVSRKGYNFVISLLSSSPSLVSGIVECLRTIDLGSKAFRQIRLINTICHISHPEVLLLAADLCEFEDISEHVVHNCLPLRVQNADYYILTIYRSLLIHKGLRARISSEIEPIQIASSCISEHPFETSMVLSRIEFNHSHISILCESLLPHIIDKSNTNPKNLKILARMIKIIDVDHLKMFGTSLTLLKKRHQRYFTEASVFSKLASLT